MKVIKRNAGENIEDRCTGMYCKVLQKDIITVTNFNGVIIVMVQEKQMKALKDILKMIDIKKR